MKKEKAEFDNILDQLFRMVGEYKRTRELPPEWEEVKSVMDKYALRVGPEKDTPPEPAKKTEPGLVDLDMEEESLGVDTSVCTWSMPLKIEPLDKEIVRLQKVRDTFVRRWIDPKTGEIIVPVKVVHNLGTSLGRWSLEGIVDWQSDRFIRRYINGKRPLPKGRYE